METEAKVQMDVIERLIKLQEIDRKRDRLQKKLDQVPIKLKEHTDAIARLEAAIAEQEQVLRVARAEADRAELEVKTREERREKLKAQMNAPKLSNREYDVIREELAGVLADVNSFSDKALKALDKAGEAEANVAKLKEELRVLSEAHPLNPEAFERIQSLRRSIYTSEDYQEGIRAFFEKRPPVFTGR